jgi:hypothetical protein
VNPLKSKQFAARDVSSDPSFYDNVKNNQLRYIVLQVTGNVVFPAKFGAPDQTYAQFLVDLKQPNDCHYGLFNFPYTVVNNGVTTDKSNVVLIFWCSSKVPTYTKNLYMAAYSGVVNACMGNKFIFTVTDDSPTIAEKNMRDYLVSRG